MKTILCFCLYFLITLSCFAQNCKFFEGKDSRSGLPVKLTKPHFFSSKQSFLFSTNQRWVHLNLMLERAYGRYFYFTAKDPIMLFFNDSTSLLLFLSPQDRNLTVDLSMDYTKLDILVYPIAYQTLKLIANKELSKIRVYYTLKIDDRERCTSIPLNDEYKEYKLSSAQKNDWLKNVNCILDIYSVDN